jgi:cytochrome c
MRTPLVASLLAFLFALPVAASDRGTPAQAKAMLEKAAAHYRAAGRKQALADFNASRPGFRDGDLYVVCITGDKKIAANGAFPQYVGASVDILKDANGKPLGTSIYESAANKNGEGTVRYPMVNPMTGKTEPKVMFTRKLGEDVCGVGAYGAS